MLSPPTHTIWGVDPFIGSEAVASGALTRGQLRWNYVAVRPNVYMARDSKRTLQTNAQAAWLWTGRSGIVAGLAAANLHGARGIADGTPIELIANHSRRSRGVVVRSERIEDDEVQSHGELQVTTAARTALDLGRRLPRDVAVRHLDALARATGVSYADVAKLLDRYRGARGVPQARTALRLMDGGSDSPEETRLRLIFEDSELPRPRTNIVVRDDLGRVAVIGMGWDEYRVGVSIYDGSRHEGCAAVQHAQRFNTVQRSGWFEIQVADLSRRGLILCHVRAALRTRRLRV